MSRPQNGFPIHAWERLASREGWVWSACGHVVAEGESSHDDREVTCAARGCQAFVAEREAQRKSLARRAVIR